MKRVLVLLVSGLLMLSFAASVALAAPPEGKGSAGAEFDERDKDAPADPSCWGDATSQVAGPAFGQHASSQEEPRLGVGNVARNDEGEGTRPSDHGAVVGPGFGASCE
jgi:hypothetical protein